MIKQYKGVDYIVTIGPLGSYVAYIKIPDEHPWNKLVDKKREVGSLEREISVGYEDIPLDVHGGLTFAGFFEEERNIWWFGFDCAHSQDFSPGIASMLRSSGLPSPHETYRDLNYVKKECIGLASRLAEVKTEPVRSISFEDI